MNAGPWIGDRVTIHIPGTRLVYKTVVAKRRRGRFQTHDFLRPFEGLPAVTGRASRRCMFPWYGPEQENVIWARGWKTHSAVALRMLVALASDVA